MPAPPPTASEETGSGPVTEANREASRQAQEEQEKWKKENPLSDRMSKLADVTAGGTSTGKGLAAIGAQIAAAVNQTKESNPDKKLSVEQVAKEV
mmetsp:Transcript_13377/g.16644  ORF Transcript_13377/g.16644 Transcript_13377/m.16644 type:complete len:95 (-) Transcript_13377:936-1220(-)|eukprot:CAMPEP_0204844212 /NCGR_PEP_ID=MMETSP1347-20130617/59_1 /ASSEMBLY_ACC=CAM_ASM_000690 /TAXON_ID=215587 /ORGANISM="Aplanochytrium stocchinoi, Strain GSBS06" /LENGTH=94 /DNA_ID=CAMNT_0051983511 /DNA_START=45 /DNA_END=329 /DNA_ORIENTATION=+